MKKIVVVGATGYTGRQTSEKILEMLIGQGEFRLVIAGREKRALERLSMDLGKRFRQPIDIMSFDVSDTKSLRVMCDGAAVVVNCSSPYKELGVPLMLSAINAKAHLIDPSDEFPYLELCSTRPSPAAEAGVAVVNGVAVNPGLVDLMVNVAARKWEPVGGVHVLYVYRDLPDSGGMRRSMSETLCAPCKAFVDRGARTVTLGQKRDFTWPGGTMKGRRISGGEMFLLPRQLPDVRTVETYRVLDGSLRRYAAMMATPLASVGALLLGRWAKEDVRATGSDPSVFVVVAEMQGDKSKRVAVVQGKGVFSTTATMLAWAARKLAIDGPRRTGVQSLSTAFNAEEFLAALGLELQTADEPTLVR